jgi:hypothetical protein
MLSKIKNLALSVGVFFVSKCCGHWEEHHRVNDKGEGYCLGFQYQPGDKPRQFDGAKFCHPCKCERVIKFETS